MIPDLISLKASPWKVLPPGVHHASLGEVISRYATNSCRRKLLSGFLRAAEALKTSGCKYLFLDGSFNTNKPKPSDYDVCWDPSGVDPAKLDPVFLDFCNKRAKQKKKYSGEFFPFHGEAEPGKTYLKFFQTDRFSGAEKGIILIDLEAETTFQYELGR
jgi:hypothetical protein